MIRIEGLTKTFGKFTAVSELDLYIGERSVFGFVGPNGAGKTTTMSIMATLLAPTEGEAFIGDYEVRENPRAVRQLIGYMPDFFGVYDNLKVTEYLDFYAGAYEIPTQNRPALIRDLLDLVRLSNKADSYVDHLSRGMKQRLGLARSLVHSPEVLILDEPASGLDPRARIELKEILKELHQMGKTILISSHILPELEEVCTDLGIIENGKLIAAGKVKDISSQVYGNRLLKVKFLSSTTKEDLAEAARIVRGKPGVCNSMVKDHTLQISFNGQEEDQQRLLLFLVQKGFPIISLEEDKGNLEDIFLAITKGVGN